eukprot:GHRQ01036137.1.p2 GENE.GHRQ01036137.1~~GHRQ01036137.1.p2  ORF type:complete len:120 (+),score=30.41 GHRQ01036137.1:434-793(+)
MPDLADHQQLRRLSRLGWSPHHNPYFQFTSKLPYSTSNVYFQHILRLQVDRLFFCAAIDKYVSCARDGSFQLWNAADLKHVRTVNNGSSWITDCLYLPLSRKMVFTTMDRAITYYDVNR